MKKHLLLPLVAIFLSITTLSFGQPTLHRGLLNACWTGHLDSMKMIIHGKQGIEDVTDSRLTLLHIAAYKGYLDIVKYLVENEVDVNPKAANGITPLHLAAQQGHKEIVQYLLDHEASITAKTEKGQTPFALAVQQNQKEVVDLLIGLQKENKTSKVTEEKDNDGNTVLHLAATANNVPTFRELLSLYPEPNVQDYDGRTPLHLACGNGDSDIVTELLATNAEVNISDHHGNSPLHYALLNEHSGIASVLLQKGAEVNGKNQSGNSPITLAIRMGDTRLVKDFLAKGANIDVKESNGSTPLHIAARRGNLEISTMLIDKGLDVNAKDEDDETPLLIAARTNSQALVEVLLAHGANVETNDKSDRTPIHYAALNGNLTMTKMFLSKGAKADAKDQNSFTPLHFASLAGAPDVAATLVQGGADVNAKTGHKSGLFSQMLKVMASSLPVAGMFVSKESIISDLIDVANEVDLTPLHCACKSGNTDVAKLLLQNKAEVDTKSTLGDTPLHIAAKKGNLPLIQLLLANNASVGLKNKEDNTPFDILFLQGGVESIQWLCEYVRSHPHLIPGLVKEEVPLLHIAAYVGDQALARMVIEQRADVNQVHNMTPLQFAIVGGDRAMVDLLVANKADLTKKSSNGSTCVHVAAAAGNDTILTTLLKRSHASVNEKNDEGLAPLMLAVGSKNLECVKSLVSAGASLNVKDPQEKTLVHYCAMSPSLEMMQYLVNEKSLDVNAADKDGITNLHIASQKGQLDVVKFLLSKKASHTTAQYLVWEKSLYGATKEGEKWGSFGIIGMLGHVLSGNTSKGWNPIHLAARNGHLDVAELLIANGESPASETSDLLTPLHLASISGDTACMRIVSQESPARLRPNDKVTVSNLIAFPGKYGGAIRYSLTAGCRISAPDKSGWTPIHWAYFYERKDAIQWLKHAGADLSKKTTSEVKVTEDIVVKDDLYPIELEGVAPKALVLAATPGLGNLGGFYYYLWR
ncbi:MAG: ankyrin repeat domain-containing protein [Bacteroidota bacterium]